MTNKEWDRKKKRKTDKYIIRIYIKLCETKKTYKRWTESLQYSKLSIL